MAAADPQTTQLEFYQAMADFKTMFPSMDDDVIEAVLRSNKGAVDATIDQLLAMSTDYENERIRLELDMKDQQTTQPVPTDQLVPIDDVGKNSTSPAVNSPPQVPSTGLPVSSRWSCSLLMLGQLPDDFLRLTPDTTQSEMELEDERIAALLQNEEFMKELRWNKDFISTLDREQDNTWSKTDFNSTTERSKPFSQSITRPHLSPPTVTTSFHLSESPPEERAASSFPLRIVDDEAAFKERLKHMGKLSKKKFSQLGRVFTGRKKRGAKSILNENATKDNLLLKEDQDSD